MLPTLKYLKLADHIQVFSKALKMRSESSLSISPQIFYINLVLPNPTALTRFVKTWPTLFSW